jgi:hypothetical protein
MTTTQAFDGINKDYFTTTEDKGARYPYLQSTIYQPTALSKKQLSGMAESDYITVGGVAYERPRMALSVDSVDMLDAAEVERLALEIETHMFGKEEVNLFVVPAWCRFIVLAKPKLYKVNKDSKEVSYLSRGDKLAGTGFVTTARLLLGMISNDQLVKDSSGVPQVFTLKLTSTKCNLVESRNPEDKTIAKLNEAVVKHHGAPRNAWATHLVSVGLLPVPRQFTSQAKGETSVGVMFEISDPKPLPTEAQADIYALVNSDDFKTLADDPFYLKSAKVEEPRVAEAEQPSTFVADIPF